MKKIFFLSTFFLGLTFQAQVLVKAGTYKSEGDNLGVEMKINEDNTYQMIFMSGKLTTKNDSIYFENKFKQDSKFVVNQFENNKNSSAIVVKINSKYVGTYNYPTYIGTQKNDKSAIEYKFFDDYKPQTPDSTEYNDTYEDIVFSIDRVKYMYLVEEKDGIATSSKYEIKETVSNIDINYSPYAIANINLRGYINDENKLIITDGRSPIIFSLKFDDNNTISTFLKPLQTDKDLNFVAPKPKNNPETVYDDGYGNYFDFKLIVDSSLKDALNTTKKTPNKFLVIAYDPNNKNENEEFKRFIKSQESAVKSNMYEKYQPEYDLYNYYLATSKDKNLFDTKNKEPQIVVLNANGDKLYNTTGTLSDNQDLFNSYSQLATQLTKANVYLKLDKTIYNKTASISDLKTAFKNSLKIETPYIGQTDYAIDSVAVAVDETVEWATEVVDSTAAVAYEYEDYDKLKDEQNLYTFKTSKEVVNVKWKQVLDHYKKQKSVDEDVVKIIKKEISNDGFTAKLFNERKDFLTDLDFESLDYLLKNYDAIIQLEKEKTNYATEVATDTVVEAVADNYNYYERSLDDVLSNVFSTNTNSYMDFDKVHFDKTMVFYKEYVAKTKENSNIYANYISTLESNLDKLSNKNELYTSFEIYFNQLTSQSTNLIESLDMVFTKNSENQISYNYNSDWSSFKNSFSSLINSTAWAVVLHEKDLELIKKAIKWSETSLKLEKNNGYYLDTLAQLYYKNGQKEIAIKTQKQALEAMKEYQESETYIEMQGVLTRMQNGSY